MTRVAVVQVGGRIDPEDEPLDSLAVRLAELPNFEAIVTTLPPKEYEIDRCHGDINHDDFPKMTPCPVLTEHAVNALFDPLKEAPTFLS